MRYKDSTLSYGDRTADLLSHMTLEEKIAQVSSARMGDFIQNPNTMQFTPDLAKEKMPNSVGYIGRVGGASDLKPLEIAQLTNRIQKHCMEETRLGIPVLFMTEGTSGVLSRDHTLFPMNISAGAMFNDELVGDMADAMREEMMATGERWVLAPVVDVIRDHRYGRYEESFGEDVYLAAQNGIAYTKGVQGNLRNGAAATLKHFVAQGISDGGRNTGPIHLGDRELFDQYAVPFEAVIQEANPASIMAAYHELDGMPCHISVKLLKDLLRKRLGFQGLTVSDGNGVQLVKTFHDYCETLEETASLTINAGIDCELDYIWREHLKGQYLAEKVDLATIDVAVAGMLSLKFQMGLFDEPYVDESVVESIVGSAAHIAVSAQMAKESMTLLKNEQNILPLRVGQLHKIAVVGPLAHNKDFAYGDYSYPTHIEAMFEQNEALSEDEAIARTLFFKKKETTYADLYHPTKTVLEGIQDYVADTAPHIEISYAAGLKDTTNYNKDKNFQNFASVHAACKGADVIIAVCGDTSGMGFENDSGESVDRVTIDLPGDQRLLLAELKKTGLPVVLVLANGRPLELSYEAEYMQAILEAWKPGFCGAEAIANVLFGKACPGGRLPVSIPKALGQLPIYYSQRLTGKKQFWHQTYLEMDLKPLYPFGFGLSYTTFVYSDIKMMQGEDAMHVAMTLTNTGTCAGDEVVQIYARKRFCSVVQPEKELKAYKRVSLPAGASAKVEALIMLHSLAFHNEANQLVLENMTLDIIIGKHAEETIAEESFPIVVAGGSVPVKRRIHTNPISATVL